MRRIINILHCLYNDSNFRLASEYPEDLESLSAVGKIKDENEKTKRLCFSVIPRFLKSSSPELRCEAVKVLAYYGWPGSYKLLMRCGGIPEQKATLYAILGDKRAIPWIINRYRRIDKERRGKPVTYFKMVYLNALYHLATPAQLPFIEEIIRKRNPAGVKQRAKEIRDRIKRLPRRVN